MKADSTEMVRCPLCDVDFDVCATYFEHVPPGTYEVFLDVDAIDVRYGWQPCPLCRHTGKVSKSLWAAYHMCFSGDRRPRWSDLTQFVAAHALPEGMIDA